MLRLSIIILLLLSLFIQVKGIALVWKGVTFSSGLKGGMEERMFQMPVRKRVAFYPSVPVALPDLNDGYLFNEIRSLEEEAEEEGPDALEAGVDVEDVLYVGSIITDTLHTGMLSVKSSQAPVMRSRSRTARKTVREKETKYFTVSLGDSFHGYKVTGIFPEKIVFERDGKVLEKYLFDPAKKRLAVPPGRSNTTKAKAADVAGRNARKSNPASVTVRDERQAIQNARRRRTVRPDISRRPPPMPAVSPGGSGMVMPPEL